MRNSCFYAKRFITADANSAPFKVLSLKKIFARPKEIPMTGIVDRIDIRQNNYILIDYKTGEKKNAFLRVEDLFSSWHSQNNGDAFQMLCYSYLIKDLFKNGELPVPMVFYLNVPVIDTSGSYISYNRQALDTPTALAALQNEFIYFLDILLKELFNFNVPSHQTDEIKTAICVLIFPFAKEKKSMTKKEKEQFLIPLIFIIAAALIVASLPREGQFKYQYQKRQPMDV